jgi:hypothetical protein
VSTASVGQQDRIDLLHEVAEDGALSAACRLGRLVSANFPIVRFWPDFDIRGRQKTDPLLPVHWYSAKMCADQPVATKNRGLNRTPERSGSRD